jgi:hypothetical protein
LISGEPQGDDLSRCRRFEVSEAAAVQSAKICVPVADAQPASFTHPTTSPNPECLWQLLGVALLVEPAAQGLTELPHSSVVRRKADSLNLPGCGEPTLLNRVQLLDPLFTVPGRQGRKGEAKVFSIILGICFQPFVYQCCFLFIGSVGSVGRQKRNYACEETSRMAPEPLFMCAPGDLPPYTPCFR